MESNLIKPVLDAGAIGLSALLLLLMWRLAKMFNITLNNHLKHLYDVNNRRMEVDEKLTSALISLSEKIGHCPHNKK